ncbi:MAG: polyphosphate kinase 2 [Cellvibrionaceae bacterium]
MANNSSDAIFEKPFNGAISEFYLNRAPQNIQELIDSTSNKDIASETYPYSKKMGKKEYEKNYKALQIELAKMQAWAKETGQRIAIVFEGRDAAGKGGTIKRLKENLNPRSARIVALPKPSDVERTQWYFQRYIQHLPSGGEIVFFDRSWYNRAVVEKVFGFCSDEQREHFFQQVTEFEDMLVNENITLIKFWLNVGRAEQLKRFLAREQDVLKQWKLSSIDIKGLDKWDEYTQAIHETFERTHNEVSPWNVVRTDDKKRARIAVMQAVLNQLDYPDKSSDCVQVPDDKIFGGPGIM